ncbi:MAG: hypothetical protein R6U98_33605 [Pirellulaceae bacterium]
MVRGIRLITCAILLTFNVQTRALEPANPGLMAEEGPKWLYCLPWWVGGKHNPEDWVKKTYIHPHMVTRDELPDFTELAKRYRNE